MQKLALMMAVMILGMSPAHGCSIGADSRSPEVGGLAEMMPLLPTWFSSGGKTLMTKDTISSAAAGGNRPVEPGGRLFGQIWPQTQLKVQGMERMGDEVLSMEKPLESGRMDLTQETRIKSISSRVRQRRRRQKP